MSSALSNSHILATGSSGDHNSSKRNERLQNSLRSSTRSARFEKTSKRKVDVVEVLKKSVVRTDLPADHPSQTESGRSIELLNERKKGNWFTNLFTWSPNTTQENPNGSSTDHDDDDDDEASGRVKNSLRHSTRSARFEKTSRRKIDVLDVLQKAVVRADLPADHPSQTESGREVHA